MCRNVYFCQKIWIRLRQHLAEIWLGYQNVVEIEKSKYSRRVEWFCSSLFLIVLENSCPSRPNLDSPTISNNGTSGSIGSAASALRRRPKVARPRGTSETHDQKGRDQFFCGQKDTGQVCHSHCVDTFWVKRLIWFSAVWRKVMHLGSKKRSNGMQRH